MSMIADLDLIMLGERTESQMLMSNTSQKHHSIDPPTEKSRGRATLSDKRKVAHLEHIRALLLGGVPLQNLQTPIPQEALDVALGEIRDVMKQYTSCADPTESAARKERLKQA